MNMYVCTALKTPKISVVREVYIHLHLRGKKISLESQECSSVLCFPALVLSPQESFSTLLGLVSRRSLGIL